MEQQLVASSAGYQQRAKNHRSESRYRVGGASWAEAEWFSRGKVTLLGPDWKYVVMEGGKRYF